MDDAIIKDNFSELSEFFSAVAKEKSENRKKVKNTIAVLENDKVPEDTPINISEDTSEDTLEPQIIRSDLANLFKNLESALLEIKENPVVSIETKEEPSSPIKKVEIIDTVDTANEEAKIESFSNLMNSLKETKEEIEEVESIIGYEDEAEEELIEASEIDYIKDTVTQITATKSKNPRQVDVYEKPITDFESLHKEFINFKHKVVEQLSSLGGGGAVRINDMDDLDTSGREDGDLLVYNSSTDKYTFSSASNPPDLSSQLSLEDSIDGNLLLNGTDADSSNAGDDFTQESGVNGGRDLDHNILQKLTSDIIPQASATYDLGSDTHRFRNLYLESDTVDIGGATISSDGSGVITISADGVTLPTGSKDADGFVLARTTAASEGAQIFKLVNLYTQASGLSTAATQFKFNGRKANTAVYTEAGHVFTLSNGDARSDAAVDLFHF